MDPDAPFARLHIGVLLDGVSLGVAVADRFRADLQQAGIGDGHCAFEFALPPDLPAGSADFRSRITLMLHGSDLQLPISKLPQDGFWFDRPDWLSHLRALQHQGNTDAVLADQLCRFVRDGYMVLPRVLPPAGAASLAAQLQAAWRDPPPALFAESFEPDGFQSFVKPDSALLTRRAVLRDPHLYLEIIANILENPFLASVLQNLCAGGMQLTGSRHPGAAWEDDPDRAIDGTTLKVMVAVLKSRRLHIYAGSHAEREHGSAETLSQAAGDVIICHPLLRYAIVPARQTSLLELSVQLVA